MKTAIRMHKEHSLITKKSVLLAPFEFAALAATLKPHLIFLLIAVVFLSARLAAATVYTYVTIPATENIQTALFSTFPTGIFIANNALATPFSIPSTPGKCGPPGNAPCNYYDGFGSSGNGKSITIDVSVAGPTDVYTLMNAYSPQPGQQLATIKFVGTGGATLTFPLIGGQDIRDYRMGVFANTLNGGIPNVEAFNAFSCNSPANCVTSAGGGNLVADEQHFTLGSNFAGQTLTQIIITDTENGPTPILLGITVGSASVSIPAISTGGVVSASAFGGFSSASPGSWIEIYGSNLAGDTRGWGGADFNGNNAPTSLDGSSVTVGGQTAFVDYISPGQINALIPSNVATGLQQITVTNAAGKSAPFNITVNAVQPGLLAPASFSINGTQYAAAFFADGTYVLPTGAIAGLSSRPAKAGDTIIFYGVGFGPVTPSLQAGQLVQQSNTLASGFQLSIGGIAATALYAGLAPNYTGLYQFNVTVPNATPGNAVPVTFTLAGANSTQTLNIAVSN
jgi:uncharacterized protein (TIGR03437 family)